MPATMHWLMGVHNMLSALLSEMANNYRTQLSVGSLVIIAKIVYCRAPWREATNLAMRVLGWQGVALTSVTL